MLALMAGGIFIYFGGFFEIFPLRIHHWRSWKNLPGPMQEQASRLEKKNAALMAALRERENPARRFSANWPGSHPPVRGWDENRTFAPCR
jgi:hypothetical protein